MRHGTFTGYWCDYNAVFYVESQDPNSWIFHGHIVVGNAYDPLWMEQYADNSLRIIRYLQGPYAGQVQTVQTYPPDQFVTDGQINTRFQHQQSYGIGCDGNPLSMVVLPRG